MIMVVAGGVVMFHVDNNTRLPLSRRRGRGCILDDLAGMRSFFFYLFRIRKTNGGLLTI